MNTPIQTKKVVLVGESGTGKTSIIQKYCKDIFTDDTNSTLGSSNETKLIHLSNKQQVKLNIWDTAGQEAFRSVNKIFYKDAEIVVLVYDITNRKSFQEVINYWYNETRSHVSDNAGKHCI
jgi:small GTP-binding protein